MIARLFWIVLVVGLAQLAGEAVRDHVVPVLAAGVAGGLTFALLGVAWLRATERWERRLAERKPSAG